MSEERTSRFAKLSDDVVFQVCHLFFSSKLRPGAIADLVADHPDVVKTQSHITRETVYPILDEGRARGFFELYAPLARALADGIEDAFAVKVPSLANVPPVQVVDFVDLTERNFAAMEVIRRAAKTAIGLVREIAKRKPGKPVHVGFASGWTTRLLARELAEEIMRDAEGVPELVLHATSPGFDEREPGTASTTFFSFFERVPVKISCVGLFAPTFVELTKYEAAQKAPGARYAFKHRDEIDLLVSALARRDDEHGELQKFISFLAAEQAEAKKELKRGARARADRRAPAEAAEFPSAEEFEADLDAAGWAGDVHYRPFSKDRAIEKGLKFMPLTLFDIPWLVERATPNNNKAMLLIAGPCGICGKPRSEALYWLMRNRDLKVWTHIVMDRLTADKLLDILRTDRGKKPRDA